MSSHYHAPGWFRRHTTIGIMAWSLPSLGSSNRSTANQMSRNMTKPTMWLCAQRRLRSAWASAQSDQSPRCPHKKAWVLSYLLSAQRRLGSDLADAQADMSLRWVHIHFVGFVMLWLKSTATSTMMPALPTVSEKIITSGLNDK